MEKMENIEKPKSFIYYSDITESYIDKEKKCVRVLVPPGEDNNYWDIDSLNKTDENIKKKYPDFSFTGGRRVESNKEKGITEILFFYE